MTNWDKRYLAGKPNLSRGHSELLKKFLPSLKPGNALDIACGEGRNALFLARNGFNVEAVDYSSVAIQNARKAALERGVSINFIHSNMNHYTITNEKYDLIIDFYYLERSLTKMIYQGLKEGGTLIFETYSIEQANIGHPRNKTFLLKPNELLSMFGMLKILYYREGLAKYASGERYVASLVARKTKKKKER